MLQVGGGKTMCFVVFFRGFLRCLTKRITVGKKMRNMLLGAILRDQLCNLWNCSWASVCNRLCGCSSTKDAAAIGWAKDCGHWHWHWVARAFQLYFWSSWAAAQARKWPSSPQLYRSFSTYLVLQISLSFSHYEVNANLEEVCCFFLWVVRQGEGGNLKLGKRKGLIWVVYKCEGVPQELVTIDNASIIIKVSHQHSALGHGHCLSRGQWEHCYWRQPCLSLVQVSSSSPPIPG